MKQNEIRSEIHTTIYFTKPDFFIFFISLI